MPLSDAERAKHYCEKNKDAVREWNNLYIRPKRLSMELNDPAKNAERLKK